MKIPKWEREDSGDVGLVEALRLAHALKENYHQRARDLARRNLELYEEVKRLREELDHARGQHEVQAHVHVPE